MHFQPLFIQRFSSQYRCVIQFSNVNPCKTDHHCITLLCFREVLLRFRNGVMIQRYLGTTSYHIYGVSTLTLRGIFGVSTLTLRNYCTILMILARTYGLTQMWLMSDEPIYCRLADTESTEHYVTQETLSALCSSIILLEVDVIVTRAPCTP
jgi:hypothetical protein